jgi:hypothetical protein
VSFEEDSEEEQADPPAQLSWVIYSIPNPETILQNSENLGERQIIRYSLANVTGLPVSPQIGLHTYFGVYSQASSSTTIQAQHRILELLFAYLSPLPVPPFVVIDLTEIASEEQVTFRDEHGYPVHRIAYSDPPIPLVVHSSFVVTIEPHRVHDLQPLSAQR